MKLLRRVLPVLIVLISISASAQQATTLVKPQVEERITKLMQQMSLDEKVGQLNQYRSLKDPSDLKPITEGSIGSLMETGAEKTNALQRVAMQKSRMKIPILFGHDVIHGFRTIFPIPLAQASSWDPAQVESDSAIAAKEAAAAGVRWTFAPMVDIARDPRWGRISEGSGEDPYLGAALAAARVRGFQGTDLSNPNKIAACAKHFAAYGAAEGGRDYNRVDMSIKTLRDIYLPPFQAAQLSGVATFMTSFNDLNGVPSTANRFLLDDTLRKEWRFQGFTVSDWNSVRELMLHSVAATSEDAAYKAIIARTDMDMKGDIYINHLADLVMSARVPLWIVDDSVRRVLRIKFLLGLFDNPYADPAREKATLLAPEHLEAARTSAQKSIVLLKNQNNLLPLPKTGKRIALIGPLADDKANMLGDWIADGKADDAVTVLAGFREKLGPNAQINHVKGANIVGDTPQADIDSAVAAAKNSDVAVLVLGESGTMTGEAASRAYLDLPGKQQQLLEAVHATGVPVVLVVMSGRPLTITWAQNNINSIVYAWFLGTQSGHALADVLFGDVNPSAKLPVTFPRTIGQVPLYYNYLQSGRPNAPKGDTMGYIDETNAPLYPFGFGLSYTTYQYSNLRVANTKLPVTGQTKVFVDIRNTGQRAGDEIAQLYVRVMSGSTSRPVRELRGFRRVALAPGETKTVEFTLSGAKLGAHNFDGEYVVDPGAMEVWVGPSSAEGLSAKMELVR
jgi:beta-glucosidase